MSAAAVLRRGFCPGLTRPMETGDGLLVRLHPRGACLSVAQARAIAAAARRFGNGRIDITARGNLQVRGLAEATHPPFVDAVIAAGIGDGARSEAPERLTIVSPLAGLDGSDRIDAAGLAEAIEDACSACTGLPAKLAIAVDGGGTWPLDEVAADFRLVAADGANGTVVALYVATTGGAALFGALAAEGVPAAMRTILHRLGRAVAEAGADGKVRHLAAPARAALLAGLPLERAPEIPARARGIRAGVVPLADGRAAVLVAPPSGCLDALQLDAAAELSARFGSGGLRLSPARGLCLPGVAAQATPVVLAEAAAAGLIVADDDARLSIVACTGKPGCAAGATTTRADAERIAAAAPALSRTGVRVHLSGCAKGCAHPATADLTLVATAEGYGVVLGGRSGDRPNVLLPLDSVARRLGALHSRAELAFLFERGGR